jgi:hypothetical protein
LAPAPQSATGNGIEARPDAFLDDGPLPDLPESDRLTSWSA